MIILRVQHNSTLYPIRRYEGYTLNEAMQRYKKEFSLRYKRNVKFYTC